MELVGTRRLRAHAESFAQSVQLGPAGAAACLIEQAACGFLDKRGAHALWCEPFGGEEHP